MLLFISKIILCFGFRLSMICAFQQLLRESFSRGQEDKRKQKFWKLTVCRRLAFFLPLCTFQFALKILYNKSICLKSHFFCSNSKAIFSSFSTNRAEKSFPVLLLKPFSKLVLPLLTICATIVSVILFPAIIFHIVKLHPSL